jgi:transcriptional regulator with XRE-family HTH domain
MDATTLKARRAGLGLSQAELAKLLGVHLMTVSKWERGVNPIPALIQVALEKIEAGEPLRRHLGRRRLVGVRPGAL